MKEFVNDYRQLVRIAREDNPDLKVVALGHSMGGGIVFAYGVQHADERQVREIMALCDKLGADNDIEGAIGDFLQFSS